MRRRLAVGKVSCTLLPRITYILITVIPLLAIALVSREAKAAAPITPSGLNTQVNLSPNPPSGKIQYDITGGTRPGGGGNLFHSFGDFNVPNNNIANFLNGVSFDLSGNPLAAGLPTSNILGRVTGGNISNIFGAIQTTGFGNANLFLMNPAGFLFGPNSTLSVGGMVAFTTADYIRLTDNSHFNAITGPADLLLTTAPVAAFGFLGSNAAAIAIQGGSLEVADGRTLSFIGGPNSFNTDSGIAVPSGVSMTGGSLSAPNGLIYMATVTSPGETLLPTLSGNPLGNFGSPSTNPAAIRIRSGEFVMDHAALMATNSTDTAQSPIDVNIQGTMAVRNGSSILSSTSAVGHGSDVLLAAQSLQMDRAAIQSMTTGIGQGGNISITNTRAINLTNGAQIMSSSTGTGNGGSITVSVPGTSGTGEIFISGFDTTNTVNGVITFLSDPNTGLPLVSSGIFSTTSGSGLGGNIAVTAPSIRLDNSSQIATSSSGDGAGGNIALNANVLNITGGAQVMSYSGFDFNPSTFGGTLGTGKAGDITVIAQESVRIADADPILQFEGSVIRSQALGVGDAGSITISAPILTLENGGTIASQNFGSGNAGNITISAFDSLSISGQDPIGNPSQISTLAFSGNTGLITITSGSVNVTDNGTIQTAGMDRGDITLQVTNNLNIMGAGGIETSGGTTAPGNITITADTILLSGAPNLGADTGRSRIRTKGDVMTGNIDIHAREFIMSDGSRISSDATAGEPGRITISGESVTIGGNAKVRMDTSNANSGGGLIEINATSLTLDQGVIQTETVGIGAAGAVNLHATDLVISGGFINSQTHFLGGRGGDVTLTATDRLSISGSFNGSDVDSARPAGIYTLTSAGGGDAGNISLNAPQVEVLGGARLSTSSFSSAPAGNIDVTAQNSLSLSGSGSGFYSEANSSGIGGTILVHSPQVEVTNGAIISAKSTGSGAAGNVTIQGNSPAQSILIDGTGSKISTETTGIGAGGDIFLNANTVTLQNGAQLSATTSGSVPEATGGTITVNGNQVLLIDNAQISAGTSGSGNAGKIHITGSESLTLNNSVIDSGVNTPTATGNGGTIELASPTISLQNSRIRASTSGFGNAGDIDVAVGSLRLASNSQIQARTTSGGNAGDISIHGLGGSESNAQNITLNGSLILSDSVGENLYVEGNGGSVSIRTGTLALQEGSGITTAATASSGVAGDITIYATENMTISQSSLISNSEFFSLGSAGKITVTAPSILVQDGGNVSTSTDYVGNAGDITFKTGSLQLTTGASLNSSSLNIAPSDLPELIPTGKAGNVTVQGPTSPAQSVSIDGQGSGILTKTEGKGAGGNISVNANSVVLQNGAQVTSSSTGAGSAGDVTINAGNQLLMINSSITTEANQSSGGLIKISTNPSGNVQLTNSKISASVLDGTGGGGSVNIDPQFVLLQNSQILAQAVQGPGGNIFITTNLLLPDANSVISASSQFGQQGTITIQSPNAPAGGRIVPLSQKPLIATTLVSQRCAALAGGEFSSFTVAGRDILPTEPGDWLSAPLALSSSNYGGGILTNADTFTSVGDLTEETPLLSLRKIAPPGFLTQAFAMDWSAACGA